MKTGIFVGRFQPLHDGHRACINKVLAVNDRCIVMIRDTVTSDSNPLSYEERSQMIRDAFPDEQQVQIVRLPDPQVACHE